MNRRRFIFSSLASGLGAGMLASPARAMSARIEVFKSPTCGCCTAWVEHMTQAGFEVETRDVDQETLWSMKARAGVTPELSSCHTAFIAGYFIEGHVPGTDVQRLLSQRPDALGLTVPGMPLGSPGMEMGNQRDAYDTLLVLPNGMTEVFARHG
ncbi:DUF411 domain-containing protein [Roseobacter sp. OBYS 0001]|uniref:DUF411 domain-containing protein n=1 Tax=Roseobacter sp. OBYS 0001 TaxID=882651 RepID=UPI001BBC8C0A|nr:DUF411 domain-containing protein [Roseobacter sp. OBYS 0001]GIT87354.1 hypothetical protein ROBYS_23700 [Roseobacter sp. OBYS 0001]